MKHVRRLDSIREAIENTKSKEKAWKYFYAAKRELAAIMNEQQLELHVKDWAEIVFCGIQQEIEYKQMNVFQKFMLRFC